MLEKTCSACRTGAMRSPKDEKKYKVHTVRSEKTSQNFDSTKTNNKNHNK